MTAKFGTYCKLSLKVLRCSSSTTVTASCRGFSAKIILKLTSLRGVPERWAMADWNCICPSTDLSRSIFSRCEAPASCSNGCGQTCSKLLEWWSQHGPQTRIGGHVFAATRAELSAWACAKQPCGTNKVKNALQLPDNAATKCLAYPASPKMDKAESQPFLWWPFVMPSTFSMTNALATLVVSWLPSHDFINQNSKGPTRGLSETILSHCLCQSCPFWPFVPVSWQKFTMGLPERKSMEKQYDHMASASASWTEILTRAGSDVEIGSLNQRPGYHINIMDAAKKFTDVCVWFAANFGRELQWQIRKGQGLAQTAQETATVGSWPHATPTRGTLMKWSKWCGQNCCVISTAISCDAEGPGWSAPESTKLVLA